MSVPHLIASELRYRRLFEAAYDGILLVNPKTRKIVDVNPFLIGFLGYTHEELVGRELFQLGLHKDETDSQVAFRELQEVGYTRYENLPLKTKDGRKVEVEFVSNLYLEGESAIIQCNVRDITARKAAESTLQAAEVKLSLHAAELEHLVNQRTVELRQSNAQLETFVYSIAHDLRAPLRTMQGFSQLLIENQSNNLNQEGRDFANFINQAAQTMDRLLADLLAFSHVSQQTIELVPVTLESAVSGAVAICDEEIIGRKVTMELVGPWPVVMAHETTLRQVLVNLIGNAIKFVENNAPRVRIRTEAGAEGRIRIWVEDNGIGIPEEFQKRIFQVFQRLHTKAYAGTGIGLAIVQKGVERMGGQVGVVSTVGEGSRFWVELVQAPEFAAGPMKTEAGW